MDTVFFIASKLLWGLAQPETLLMLLIAAAWLTLRRRPGLSRGMLTVALAVMVISSIWPVQNLLLAPLESRYTRPADPGRIDGILVLGGGELTDLTLTHDQSQTNSAGERFTEAMALALRHPEAAVIFTGGSGALMGAPPGALVAERIFGELGLPPERLRLESASRNTAENARMTKELIRPQPGQRWVLVTSAFHMPRSVASFCAAGWTGLILWPTDYRASAADPGWQMVANIYDFSIGLREWIGLVAYDWTGRATLPTGDCLAPL